MPIDWEKQLSDSLSGQDINITVKEDDRESSGVGNIDFNQLLSDSIRGVQSTIEQNQAARAQRGTQQPPTEERGAIEQGISDVGSGANRGFAQLLGLPVDLASMGLRAAGVDVSDNPALGSRHLISLFKKFGGIEEPRDEGGRFIQRVGEEIGASVIPGIGLGARALRGGAGAGARAVGRELTSATAAGVGAATAQQIAPDSVVAELIGTAAPGAIAAGGQAAARGALRGGEAGRQVVEQSIGDFAAAGTTPTVSQATNNARTAMLESTLGRIPGGADVIRATAQRTQDQIQENVNRIIERTSGGSQVSAERTGRVISEGLDNFSARARVTSERLWSPVSGALPPQTAVRADNTARVLDRITSPIEGASNLSSRLSRIENPQAGFLARALVSDLGDNGTIPYEALKPLRSQIGRMMTSRSLVSDMPRAQLSQIYGALTEDIRQAIITNSPNQEIAQRSLSHFDRANRYTRGLHDRAGKFLDKLGKKVTPEEVFFSATTGVSGKRGGTQARRLMRSLGADERKAVSATLVQQLGAANPSDVREFSINRFFRNYNNMSDEAKSAFFGRQDMGGLKKNLDQIQGTIKRVKEGVETLANPSGTAAAGANIAFTALAGQAALRGDVNQLSMLAGGAAGANISAKLMTSPKFVKWLAQSTKIPTERIPGHLARLATVSKDMPIDDQEEVFSYLQEFSSGSEQ